MQTFALITSEISDEPQPGTWRAFSFPDISPGPEPQHRTNSAKNKPNSRKKHSEILTGIPSKKKPKILT
jgi:hypothetical protein